jgi:hypothetical protein
MHELDDIAKRWGTDKSSEYHNYCNKYQKYLPFTRSEKLTILEIGVLQGQSVQMWSKWFTNSEIIGIDISPNCKDFQTEKINIEIGDATDPLFMSQIIDKWPQFDLIIDDGSHMQSDMIQSFKLLFGSLKSGGVYIVEDTCCSYWSSYGGGLKSKNTSVEYFKDLVDHVNFMGIIVNGSYDRREDRLIRHINQNSLDIRYDIESINFLNSTIIITKR